MTRFEIEKYDGNGDFRLWRPKSKPYSIRKRRRCHLGEKIGDDNEAYVLLNSLQESYNKVKNALKYGREFTKIDAIISALRTKEIELQVTKKEQSGAEGLFVKGNSKPNHSESDKQQHIRISLNRS